MNSGKISVGYGALNKADFPSTVPISKTVRSDDSQGERD